MRRAVILGFLALAGCSGGSPQPRLSQGWSAGVVEGCCSIGIPPGAKLAPVADSIDDPVTLLRGSDFEAMITVTSMGTGLPLPSSGTDYRTATRALDGHEARIASFVAPDASDRLPQKRHLVWTFEGRNDGTGRTLVMSFACRQEGCAVFEPLIASLDLEV
jgi:hypothetical protein